MQLTRGMWYNRAMDIRLARLMEAMVVYDRGDARRIEHFVKVHDFAATIGTLEGLPAHDVAVLEEAAILHDVGIHVSEREHGGNNGKHQELYGPDEAEKVMRSVGCFSQEEIEQVRFLIAHHHTYTHISTLSWQILVEADFLVNLYEDGAPEEEIRAVRQKMIRTSTGQRLFDAIFQDTRTQKLQGLQFTSQDGYIRRPR